MGFIIFCVIAYFVISSMINGSNGSASVNTNKTNTTCPYCNTAYYITKNGDYNCSECGKLFKYRNGNRYREDERLPIITENICTLFTVLCKADGVITKEEVAITKDLLVDYIGVKKSKDMNMATDILNKSKGKIYSKTMIVDIDNIIREHVYSKEDAELCRELILRCSIIISHCDGKPSDNQNKILDDIVSIFNISATTYTNLINEFRSEYVEKSKDNYYKILGISEGSSKEDIKAAYRKLSKLYHPDVYASKNLPPEIIKEFEDKLAKINEAYNALK